MARETINGISVPIPGTGEPADFQADLREFAYALPASIEDKTPHTGFVMESPTETLATETSILPIGSLDGVPYGKHNTTGATYKSVNDGATWTLVNTVGGLSIHALGDGEVLLNGGGSLKKSSGWASNPTTATFTTVATANGASQFLVSDVDTYQNIVIAAEYLNPRTDARFVKVSTDNGATFTNVLDLDVMHPGKAADTHWHAVCIDKYHTGPNPRLWVSHGDNPRGVLYSDDLGATWTIYGPVNTWQPMPLIATPNGIVTLTDQNNPDGVWLIPRDLGPRKQLARIVTPFWLASLLGFGVGATRDEATGIVYLTFRADQQTHFTRPVRSFVFASDGHRADLIYSTEQTGTLGVLTSLNWTGLPTLTKSGKLLLTYNDAAGGKRLVSGRVRRGSNAARLLDAGNTQTGSTAHRNSIAIGPDSISPSRSVVIGALAGTGLDTFTDERVVAVGEETEARTSCTVAGFQAKALGTFSTVVGSTAQAKSSEGVAVGDGAVAWQNSTALGRNAVAGATGVTNPNALALGRNSSATGGGAIGIGTSSSATGLNAVAIGTAQATAQEAVAVGNGAQAGSPYSIALGSSAIANGGSAIALGRSATAAGTDGIALGTSATSGSGQMTVAIGKSASGATFWRSVALGSGSTVTDNDQIAINNRVIEGTEMAADPVAPAPNKGRFYFRDGGSGKTQLVVRFNTGPIQVISTEP